MSLRERKKARTRRALGDAAVRLFLDRGFEATTVEDIVAASGVSRRTFFRYFPSKEAAFFASHDERFEAFVERVARIRETRPAWTACCEAFLEAAASYEADRDGSTAWRRVMMSSEALQAQDLRLDALWEGEVRRVLRADGLPPLEAAVAAGALMGVVRATLSRWFASHGDLIGMGRRAMTTLDQGLVATLAEHGIDARAGG